MAARNETTMKNRNLNPVLTPANVNEIKAAMVAEKREHDAWYQWNMGRLMLARQLGTVSATIAHNVAERLNKIANVRNAI